jgi:hypothetical protein
VPPLELLAIFFGRNRLQQLLDVTRAEGGRRLLEETDLAVASHQRRHAGGDVEIRRLLCAHRLKQPVDGRRTRDVAVGTLAQNGTWRGSGRWRGKWRWRGGYRWR